MLPILLLPALVQVLPAPEAPKAPWEGTWVGAIQVPGAPLEIRVTIAPGSPWTGRIAIPTQGIQGLELADLRLEGSKATFRLAGIPGDPAFAGERGLDGALAGTFTQGGQAFPFRLTRGLAAPATLPAPAAPAPPAAGDREVSFPGFNAFPLKGSVRKGEGHPYFAVMVAGSGPTDRNWSNPLIRDLRTGQPMASHAGRDVATWLATQGIGSLRWDKRFIGSKDPTLDISLDAQAGDIRAAMTYARSLPEARGRKLLLVGHSEGALLSLLAAQSADAALLLALPPQSMARTILEQVKLQLPPDRAPANLAYLEATFKAIREAKSLPEASPEVFPGVVQLAKGLMRPESLGFVRDTLDLDPWAMAGRLALPCAVAWGDRDIQTWKPGEVPAGFPGAVIELPEANHLLKREPRLRKDLSGANAGSAYGDDTPMADLSPLAAWLGRLK